MTKMRRWACFTVMVLAAPVASATLRLPAPSAFEAWPKPLDEVHRAVPAEAPRVVELEKQVTALRQRRTAARDAAATAERDARAALTRAKAAEQAYARAPKASADPKLLATAQAEYKAARGHWSVAQKQLSAVAQLEANLAAQAEAANVIVTAAKASSARVEQAKPELVRARRQAAERARTVAETAKAALRRTGYERAGSFEENVQKQQKASAELAAQTREAKLALGEVKSLLARAEQAPPAEPSTKPGEAPTTKAPVTPTAKPNRKGAAQ